MQNINYDRISKSAIPELFTNTFDHCTGHVYLLFKKNGEYYVIVGHNKDHDNIASFGGFVAPGESLKTTILREYEEETLNCLFPTKQIERMLLDCNMIITRKSAKGQHYTAFCDIGSTNVDIEEIEQKFAVALTDPNLTADQKENDKLVVIALRDIMEKIDEVSPIVKDSNGIDRKIRDINMPAYRYLIKNIETI